LSFLSRLASASHLLPRHAGAGGMTKRRGMSYGEEGCQSRVSCSRSSASTTPSVGSGPLLTTTLSFLSFRLPRRAVGAQGGICSAPSGCPEFTGPQPFSLRHPKQRSCLRLAKPCALLPWVRGRWAGRRRCRGIANRVGVSWPSYLLHDGKPLVGRRQGRKGGVRFRLIPVRDRVEIV
jgi:hypothetical protein